MNVKLDAHYSNPRLAEIYDAGNGWTVDRDFYLELAGSKPIRVLDLGCGTGLICDEYAERRHIVYGADPSLSMIEVARRKRNGSKIKWIVSDSQSFSLNEKFDLIIMTGHAFQVLLADSDVRATFQAMRKHLVKGGTIAFESRNPMIEWDSRWNKTSKLLLSSGEISVERRVGAYTQHRIQFETFYKFKDETIVSKSELHFWSKGEIEKLLGECGLKVREFYGDWDRSAFDPSTSEEMIFIVQDATEESGRA